MLKKGRMGVTYHVTKTSHISKEKRTKLVDQTIDSIQRGVPDDTLIKKLLFETQYSLSGVKNLMAEAHIKAETRRRKQERLD